MDVQTVLALLIVLAAVAYVARRAWRTLHAARVEGDGGAGCGTCGCEPDRKALVRDGGSK